MARRAQSASKSRPAANQGQITIPETITNRSGVSEDIDNEVFIAMNEETRESTT